MRVKLFTPLLNFIIQNNEYPSALFFIENIM